MERKGQKLESNWLPAHGSCRVVEVRGRDRLVVFDPVKQKLKEVSQCYARVVGHTTRVKKSVFVASQQARLSSV